MHVRGDHLHTSTMLRAADSICFDTCHQVGLLMEFSQLCACALYREALAPQGWHQKICMSWTSLTLSAHGGTGRGA